MLAILMVIVSTIGQPDTSGRVKLKENLDLPYNATGIANDEEESPEVIVFYGQIYEGDAIFYVLDRSGSTKNGKLEVEQREVTRNVLEFSNHVEFGIFFFDEGLQSFPATGKPAEAIDPNKRRAIEWVLSQVPGGGTCPGLGLLAAIEMARNAESSRKTIIYLGDGCTTCPGTGALQYAKLVLGQVAARNTERLKIHTICVGPPISAAVCTEFPRELSAATGGRYTRIVTNSGGR